MNRHEKQLAQTREKILEAAEKLFLTSGYNVSMDDIQSVASVSRATLFSHFGSKENLFRAVIKKIGEREIPPILGFLKCDQNYLANLASFGRSFAAAVLSPGRLAMHRMAIVEGVRFPELADSHYSTGIGTVLPPLQEFLAWGQQAGLIRKGELAVQAEQLCASFLGYRQYRAMLGQRELPGRERTYIIQAIEAILTPAGALQFKTVAARAARRPVSKAPKRQQSTKQAR